MRNEIDIDELLADTWLSVVQLRNGVVAEEGEALYERCRAQVERVQDQLQLAGYDSESVEHITYAQCALLDETALGRQGEDKAPDNGHIAWQRAPLQARFFGSLQAGEALYERIRSVLRQPAPDITVLTCFHRVLLLGFQGQYSAQTINPHQREQTLAALAGRVTPFNVMLPGALLSKTGRVRGGAILRSLWFWVLVAIVVVSGVWWGGHVWLQHLINQQLPGQF